MKITELKPLSENSWMECWHIQPNEYALTLVWHDKKSDEWSVRHATGYGFPFDPETNLFTTWFRE